MGTGEESNVVVSSWGEITTSHISSPTVNTIEITSASSPPPMIYAHDDIAVRMSALLTKQAVRMAGTRYSILIGYLSHKFVSVLK